MALRPELGSHEEGSKTGQGESSLLSALPPHGFLYSSEQPCQIHEEIPIFQTRKLRPKKIQYLCSGSQCRWQS